MLPLLVSILVLGLVVAAGFFIYLRVKSQEAASAQMLQVVERSGAALREQLNAQVLELNRQMNEHLSRNNSVLSQNTRQYTDAIGQVQNRLGELQEATRRMAEIGKDISSLQDILQSPKLRGGLGEFILEELLRQVLPRDAYEMQYGFQSGQKVDAVIRLGDKLIPVDAKFPLENFRKMLDAGGESESKQARKEFIRDVKKHVDSIASKYIVPGEGTFDFAFMCVPAENVFYEIMLKDESEQDGISAYARERKIVPVSPNSFYAYLMALAHGFRSMKIERSAQEILERLGQLETDFRKCTDDFAKLGTHLQHAQTAYKSAERKIEKFQDRLESLDQTAIEKDGVGALPGFE